MFGSTLVVKIKNTGIHSALPKKNNRDKENIILPLFTTGRLGPLPRRGSFLRILRANTAEERPKRAETRRESRVTCEQLCNRSCSNKHTHVLTRL
jgi:hypothetical protein